MTAQPVTAPVFSESFQLDSAESGDRRVFVTPSGRMVRLSADAQRLLEWHEQGRTAAEIAALVYEFDQRDVTPQQIDDAIEHILARIRTIDTSSDFQGMWFKRTIIPQHWVESVAKRLTWLFHPVAGIVLLLASISVVTAAWIGVERPNATTDPSAGLIGLLLANLSIVAHEFGHAAAAARFGIRPREIGVGIYILFPVFYSNVNDSWRLNRQQRFIVGGGGLYFQLFVLCGYAFAYGFTHAPPFYWAVLTLLFSFVSNLNPFFKFDGYWLLSDLLGVANLQAQTREMFVRVFGRLRGQKAARPLPFSRPLVLAMLAYSTLAVSFWCYVAWNVVRFLISLVSFLPRQIHTFVAATALSPAHVINAALPLIQALVLFIVIIGFVAGVVSRLIPVKLAQPPQD